MAVRRGLQDSNANEKRRCGVNPSTFYMICYGKKEEKPARKVPAKHTEDLREVPTQNTSKKYIKPIADHIENANTSHMIYHVSRQPDAS